MQGVPQVIGRTKEWIAWILSILALGSFLLTTGFSLGKQTTNERVIADHESRIRQIEAADIKTNLEWIKAKTDEISKKLEAMEILELRKK